MVTTIHSGATRPRKLASSRHLVADSVRRRVGESRALAHPDLVDHPLVTPDDQLRLIATVEAHDRLSIDDLVQAVPDHPAPISAILVLVDAGLLAIDLEAPFDASVQVWRPSPRPRC